jgi:hypothetical protein
MLQQISNGDDRVPICHLKVVNFACKIAVEIFQTQKVQPQVVAQASNPFKQKNKKRRRKGKTGKSNLTDSASVNSVAYSP